MGNTSIHEHDNSLDDISVAEDELIGQSMSEKSQTDKKKKKKNQKQADNDRSGYSTTFYLHAMLLFGGRILHKALSFYNSLFELTSQEKAKIYRNISTHYANKGHHEKSLEHLKDWVKLEPANQDAHYQLGLALSATGNSASAIRCFEKVLKLNPEHKGGIYHKSILFVKMKNFEQALEGFKKLCDITENAKVYYNMGIAYDGLNQVDDAITSLEKAVEIDPDEIKYHQYLGFLNVRNDDHKKAAGYFTKVMELERERDDDF
ncbi:magnetosome protein MamA [Candidatus Magnetomorum sp. HK-1]|nr:magnetosome protein MamA [Candidatus Magnetomorum sp. HK-1]